MRLRRVNFSQTINVGGIAATQWIDGHMGWELSLKTDSGIIMLTNGKESFAVSPACWNACEVGDPVPQQPALTVIETLPAVSAALTTEQAKAERITVAEIRSRQAEAQQARSRET